MRQNIVYIDIFLYSAKMERVAELESKIQDHVESIKHLKKELKAKEEDTIKVNITCC